MSVIGGGTQEAKVGEELPEAVVVRATDAQSVAVAGQLINFVVVTGGGHVFAGAALTNAQGEARERWTLGTVAGEQVLEARAVDQASGNPIVFARITATADPGPPATLEVSQSEHHMLIGDRLDLAALTTVQDQYGNTVLDAPLTVTAPPPFDIQGATVGSVVEHQGQVTVESGAVQGTLTLTVVRHLSVLVGAQGGYSCFGLMVRQGGPQDTDPRGVVTRYEATFAVDSAVYPALAGSLPSLWITKSLTLTREDGSVETVQPLKEALQVIQQVGHLYLGMEIGVVDVTNEAPLTYQGIAVCPNWWQVTSFQPYTIAQRP